MTSQYSGPYPRTAYGQGPPAGYPAGWQPPFQGPPPMPAGVNINPQHWQSGIWQFNPSFNPAQGRPPPPNQAPWAAGNAWHAQAQAQAQAQAGASYNPYKRVPRPPSAEYMATKLSDNPLGLTNMIPREELYGSGEDAGDAPHTPWIWNPRGLVDDGADAGIITADFRDPQGRRIAQESRGPTPSRQTSLDRPNDPSPGHSQSRPSSSAPQHQQYRESSQARHATDPTSQYHHREPTPARHASEPAPQIYAQANSRDSTPNRRGSMDQPNHTSASNSNNDRTTLPPLDRPLDRPRDPSSIYYQRRYPDGVPSPTSQGPVRPNNDRPNPPPPQDDTFTSKRELQPTFSTNIVRTPGHYQSSSPNRSNSTPASAYGTPTNSISASQLAARMERLSTGSTNNSMPLTRQASMPSQPSPSSSGSSVSGVSSFVDEPTSMLSPLMLGATPKPSARPIGRGFSVPAIGGSASLSSIPEASPSLNSSLNPSPSRRSSSSRTSPADSPYERHITPPNHNRLSNPLPPPPVEIRYPMSSPQRRSPPSSYRKRVRRGFWNRRGDHLTLNGFIVYAPPEKANPDELRDYPAEGDGYRDHMGIFSEYRVRPELPESLPRHGQSPVQPYDSFVIYEYIQ